MTRTRRGPVWPLATLVALQAAAGCSSGTGKESPTVDSAVSHDSPAAPEVEPGAEAGLERGTEAGVEVAPDGGRELGARPEVAADVAVGSQPEVGRDSGSNVGTEVRRDVGAEAGRESGVEVAGDAKSETRSDSAGDGGLPVYQGIPQPMCVWNEAYQENYAPDTVAEVLASARGCYVLVDPFANNNARAAIGQMKQNGNLVSCYISVGTCEDWRDDFAAMKPYCVTKQWGQWPGEYFVDRTDTGLLDLMKARIDKMTGWGCNMVEFDNMDWAFDSANRSQYGITATAAQAEAYNQALCAHVHGSGMGCMAKSSAQGASEFDGLTVESSPDDMDWWTPRDMSDMLSTGRIGIVVHYNETDCAAVRATYQAEYGSKLSFICEDRALKKYRHFP